MLTGTFYHLWISYLIPIAKTFSFVMTYFNDDAILTGKTSLVNRGLLQP